MNFFREDLTRDDVGNFKGGGDPELSEQGELDGEGGGEADCQAGQTSQQEEVGQGGPPAVTLYRRILQQDGGQLHQAKIGQISKIAKIIDSVRINGILNCQIWAHYQNFSD